MLLICAQTKKYNSNKSRKIHERCWIYYPNHRCAIACKEREEALEANNIHEKLRTGQRKVS
jgi:hypothetical protein